MVYAVPGHPWVGEATTRLILEQAAAAGLTVQVVGGLSFVEPSLAAVGVDVMDGGQVVDAMLLGPAASSPGGYGVAAAGRPTLQPRAGVGCQADADERLSRRPPGDGDPRGGHDAADGAAPCRCMNWTITTDFDHLTSLYVPPLSQGSFTALQEIVAHLRAPEGCPWDHEQTMESLRKDLLGRGDGGAGSDRHWRRTAATTARTSPRNWAISMLVATMMVQIATEEGRFRLADVMHDVVAKLIRRHPHVFGATEVENVDQILRNWDAIKAAEKAAKGQTVERAAGRRTRASARAGKGTQAPVEGGQGRSAGPGEAGAARPRPWRRRWAKRPTRPS